MTPEQLIAHADPTDPEHVGMLKTIAHAHKVGDIDLTDCENVTQCVSVYARFLLVSHSPRFGRIEGS